MRIQVEVKDEKLVVTMDDTSYRAIFYKSPDEPRLIQAASLAVDREAPMSHEDFEALAWTAARLRRGSWAGSCDLAWVLLPAATQRLFLCVLFYR